MLPILSYCGPDPWISHRYGAVFVLNWLLVRLTHQRPQAYFCLSARIFAQRALAAAEILALPAEEILR